MNPQKTIRQIVPVTKVEDLREWDHILVKPLDGTIDVALTWCDPVFWIGGAHLFPTLSFEIDMILAQALLDNGNPVYREVPVEPLSGESELSAILGNRIWFAVDSQLPAGTNIKWEVIE